MYKAYTYVPLVFIPLTSAREQEKLYPPKNVAKMLGN